VSTLQEEQKPIDIEIVNSLIGCTPELWQAAELIIEKIKQVENGPGGLLHQITNPEGSRDLVSPSEDLYLATRRLEMLFSKHGISYFKAVYLVTLQPDGDWKFKATFTYGDERQ
jgi:hypothetical protein